MNPKATVARFATRWRGLLFLRALLEPFGKLVSVLTGSESFRLATLAFWSFSRTCIFGIVFGNVRKFERRHEKALIILCGVLFGAGEVICGDVFWAVFWIVIMPLSFYTGASMWSKLPDQDQKIAVTNLFKSLPYTLGSLLYLSSASLRCLLAADETMDVMEQCGNPIAPAHFVSNMVILTRGLSYILSPISLKGT